MGSTGKDLQDIDFAEGNLWVLYPSPSGDIVFSRVNIDSGALEFTVTTNIPMTSSASFAWDRLDISYTSKLLITDIVMMLNLVILKFCVEMKMLKVMVCMLIIHLHQQLHHHLMVM